MTSSWQSESGHLKCCWPDVGGPDHRNPLRIEPAMQGSYLPPVPEFASHSPFGGATWFLPAPPVHDFE